MLYKFGVLKFMYMFRQTSRRSKNCILLFFCSQDNFFAWLPINFRCLDFINTTWNLQANSQMCILVTERPLGISMQISCLNRKNPNMPEINWSKFKESCLGRKATPVFCRIVCLRTKFFYLWKLYNILHILIRVIQTSSVIFVRNCLFVTYCLLTKRYNSN